jgi:hypothetical protein
MSKRFNVCNIMQNLEDGIATPLEITFQPIVPMFPLKMSSINEGYTKINIYSEINKYLFIMSKKIILESKKDMRSRGLASPDAADAICVTFAFPMAHRETVDKTPRRGYSASGVLTSWMGA